jgi:hypothetical protein
LKNWSVTVSLTRLKETPTVWLDGEPELPLPAENVCPGRVTNSLLAAPAVSVKVPRLVLDVMPLTVAPPESVIDPEASGVPAEGRTRTFCHVRLQVTPELLTEDTVKVICVVLIEVMATEVPLATPLILRPLPPTPPTLVTRTVGAVPPVSKTKPLGALRTIVPVPMSPDAPSVSVGPVSGA